MVVINSMRARFVPNVIDCSVYYDAPSDIISFVSYLICFSTVKESYAVHKRPTSALNEYGLLMAVRRLPGSNHEICARTHDHWDNSPCPDHGFSLSTLSSTPLLSHPGLEWLMSGTDGKLRPLYFLAEQGEGQCPMGDIRMNKICHPTSLIAFFLMIIVPWSG